MDVLQVPVVVRRSDARRGGHPGVPRLEPPSEPIDGLFRLPGVGDQVRVDGGQPVDQAGQHDALLPLDVDAGKPEVARLLGQIAPGLIQQSRHGSQFDAHRGPGQVAQRERILVEAQRARPLGPLARRNIGRRGMHHRVERRVARPRVHHPMVEIEAVHLGLDQPVVDLLGDRPRRVVDGGQPRLEAREAPALLVHGGARVVGDALDDLRPLECAPLLEQPHERVVVGRSVERRAPAVGSRTGRGQQPDDDQNADRDAV